MIARGLLVIALLLAPEAALACPTCVSSAFGDRSFNWAYLGLIAAPFLLTGTIGGILAWSAGYRPRAITKAFTDRRRTLASQRHRGEHEAWLDKETT
jgi:hypothetical protein